VGEGAGVSVMGGLYHGHMVTKKSASLNIRKKSLSESSKTWVKRQLRDPYVIRAQADGLRARSAYKLLEIDEKFHILKNGMSVVDLGCAPGSWCQIAASRNCKVIGIDLLPCDALAGVEFIQADFTTEEGLAKVEDAMGGKFVDIVLCDMAANTVGHKETDGLRTQALSELAMDFALEHVRIGGNFCTKLFMNGYEGEAKKRIATLFERVQLYKPSASRAESREIFLIGVNRKK
jgi:23S rRNA (uridine2552-2'-O)-methyltransferase